MFEQGTCSVTLIKCYVGILSQVTARPSTKLRCPWMFCSKITGFTSHLVKVLWGKIIIHSLHYKHILVWCLYRLCSWSKKHVSSRSCRGSISPSSKIALTDHSLVLYYYFIVTVLGILTNKLLINPWQQKSPICLLNCLLPEVGCNSLFRFL